LKVCIKLFCLVRKYDLYHKDQGKLLHNIGWGLHFLKKNGFMLLSLSNHGNLKLTHQHNLSMLSKNETITCLELMKNDCRLLKSLYKVYTEQAAAEKPRETNAASEL
jgi:hypothetical protein